jgi:hypothetical protein
VQRMRLLRMTLLAAGAVAIFGTAAAPAAATSIQNAATGQEYTGIWGGGLGGSGFAVFTGSSGSVTCNQSTLGGQITAAGSGGPTATGNINDASWRNSGGANLPCTDTIALATHTGFQAQNLPWLGSAVWLSDNTSGPRNGTFTFDGVRIRVLFNAEFIGPINCDYVGDHDDTGATTRRLQGDLFNPDNTSGNTELRFEDEPLELVVADSNPNCDVTGEFTATYGIAGQSGIKLQIRQDVARPPAANPPASTPSSGATAGQTGSKPKKCKRKKGKRAAAAKKKCKKKR